MGKGLVPVPISAASAQMAARHLLNRKTGLLANFRCGSRLCKNVFPPPKLHATGDDPRRHDGLRIFLLYRVRSQPGRKLGPR